MYFNLAAAVDLGPIVVVVIEGVVVVVIVVCVVEVVLIGLSVVVVSLSTDLSSSFVFAVLSEVMNLLVKLWTECLRKFQTFALKFEVKVGRVESSFFFLFEIGRVESSSFFKVEIGRDSYRSFGLLSSILRFWDIKLDFRSGTKSFL